MNNKGQAFLGIIFLVLIVGGSVGAGYLLGGLKLTDRPRSDHKAIATQISTMNVPYQIQCKLEYAKKGNVVPLSVFEFQNATTAEFSYGTPYPVSEWRFTYGGYTLGYMLIVGPDNVGEVYYISIVSFSRHHFQITTPIETVVLTMENWRYDTIIKLVQSG